MADISKNVLINDIITLKDLWIGNRKDEKGKDRVISGILTKYNKKPRQRKTTLQALKTTFVKTLYNDYYNNSETQEKVASYNKLMTALGYNAVIGHEREVYTLSSASGVAFSEQDGVKVAKYKVKDENGNLVEVEIKNPVFDSIDDYKLSHALLTHIFGANYRHLSIPVTFDAFIKSNFRNSRKVVKETITENGITKEIENIVWENEFSENDLYQAIAVAFKKDDILTDKTVRRLNGFLRHYAWIDGLYQEISKDENGNQTNIDANGNVLHIDVNTFIALTTGVQIKSNDGKTTKVKSIAEVLQKITGTTEKYSITELETTFNDFIKDVLNVNKEFTGFILRENGEDTEVTATDRIQAVIDSNFLPVLTQFASQLEIKSPTEIVSKLRKDINDGVYKLSDKQKNLVLGLIDKVEKDNPRESKISEEDLTKIKSMNETLSGFITTIGTHTDFIDKLKGVNSVEVDGKKKVVSNDVDWLINEVFQGHAAPGIMDGSTKQGRLALLNYYAVIGNASSEQRSLIEGYWAELSTLQGKTVTELKNIIGQSQTISDEQLISIKKLLVKPETLKEGETDNSYMTQAGVIYTKINEITKQITGTILQQEPVEENPIRTRIVRKINKRVARNLYNQQPKHSRVRRAGSKFMRNFYWTIPVAGIGLAALGIAGGALFAGAFIAGQAAVNGVLAVVGGAAAVAGAAPITFGITWALSDRFRQFVRRGRAESRMRHLNNKIEKMEARVKRLRSNIVDQARHAQRKEKDKLKKDKQKYDKELVNLHREIKQVREMHSGLSNLMHGKYSGVDRKFYHTTEKGVAGYEPSLQGFDDRLTIIEEVEEILTGDNVTNPYRGTGVVGRLKTKNLVPYKKVGGHGNTIEISDVHNVDIDKSITDINTQSGNGAYKQTLAHLNAMMKRLEGQDVVVENPVIEEKDDDGTGLAVVEEEIKVEDDHVM